MYYSNRPVLFALAASVVALVVVVELVRRRRLKEEYSLIWLLTGATLVALSLSRPLLDELAAMVGIAYGPTMLFILAFGFMFLILLQFSTVISRLSDENKRLAQEIAILRCELRALQEHTSAPADED